MRPPDDHLPFSLIADLAEGRAALSDSTREHLNTCGRCAGDLAWMRRLIDLGREANLEEPPAHAVVRAKGLFRELRRRPPLGQRLIQALLRFDSAVSAPAFGLRAAATLERQLLLDADGYMIDLRINPTGNGQIVSGQLLTDAPTLPGTATVDLLGPQGRAQAELNELSEFTLGPVRPGRYSLTIILNDEVILVPGLDLGF